MMSMVLVTGGNVGAAGKVVVNSVTRVMVDPGGVTVLTVTPRSRSRLSSPVSFVSFALTRVVLVSSGVGRTVMVYGMVVVMVESSAEEDMVRCRVVVDIIGEDDMYLVGVPNSSGLIVGGAPVVAAGKDPLEPMLTSVWTDTPCLVTRIPTHVARTTMRSAISAYRPLKCHMETCTLRDMDFFCGS